MNIENLPKKARLRLDEIREILLIAEDGLYCVEMFDYKCGLIKFRHLLSGIGINLYSTTFTATIEHEGKQYHKKKLTKEQVIELFNEPLFGIKNNEP